MVIVSHDRELLGLVDQIADLSAGSVRMYGGKSGGDGRPRLKHAVVGPQPQQDHGELAGHANPRLGRRGPLGQPEARILTAPLRSIPPFACEVEAVPVTADERARCDREVEPADRTTQQPMSGTRRKRRHGAAPAG